MTNTPYKIKQRPALLDLSIMDGVLNGGGHHAPTQREAYWGLCPNETPDALNAQILENDITLSQLKRKP